MNITLLGATGKTGKEVLNQALARGDKITAVVRTPSKLTITNPNLTIIKGDATDAKTLGSAMSGNEVVISTLGSMKNGTLITDSTKAIVSAAKATGLQRVIMMSSFAVNRDKLQSGAKFITGIVMKKIINDKIAGEAGLRSSGLKWTIVYATGLSNSEKKGTVRLAASDEKLGMSNKITRADVAAWMLSEAKEAQYVNKDVTITQ